MVKISFRSQAQHYDLPVELEGKLIEFVKSLGASTDGNAYNLRKRDHVALVEQYVKDLK